MGLPHCPCLPPRQLMPMPAARRALCLLASSLPRGALPGDLAASPGLAEHLTLPELLQHPDRPSWPPLASRARAAVPGVPRQALLQRSGQVRAQSSAEQRAAESLPATMTRCMPHCTASVPGPWAGARERRSQQPRHTTALGFGTAGTALHTLPPVRGRRALQGAKAAP